MISLIFTMLCEPYTYYVNCVNSRCFVTNLLLLRLMRFCVKLWPRKLRSGKSFDKYHACKYILDIQKIQNEVYERSDLLSIEQARKGGNTY